MANNKSCLNTLKSTLLFLIVCVHTQVKVLVEASDFLDLELQASCEPPNIGARSSLQEQHVVLTIEPTLQSQIAFKPKHSCSKNFFFGAEFSDSH